MPTSSCLVSGGDGGVIKHEGPIRSVRPIFLLYTIGRELVYCGGGGGSGGVVVLLCISERDVRRRQGSYIVIVATAAVATSATTDNVNNKARTERERGRGMIVRTYDNSSGGESVISV